jgi:S1 RNA binding domain
VHTLQQQHIYTLITVPNTMLVAGACAAALLSLQVAVSELSFRFSLTYLCTAALVPDRGETVTGVVVQYEQRGLLVDIGAKASAYLPLREAGLVPCEDIETLFSIDDSCEFMVSASCRL